MNEKRRVDPEPEENRECTERELEGLRGGTIVDEPDPIGRTHEPLPIIEGPDPV